MAQQFDLEGLRQAYRREASLSGIAPVIQRGQQINQNRELNEKQLEQRGEQFNQNMDMREKEFEQRGNLSEQRLDLSYQQEDRLQQAANLEAMQAIQEHQLSTLKMAAIKQKMQMTEDVASFQARVAQYKADEALFRMQRQKTLADQEKKTPKSILQSLQHMQVGPDGKTVQQVVLGKNGVEFRTVPGAKPSDLMKKRGTEPRPTTVKDKIAMFKTLMQAKYGVTGEMSDWTEEERETFEGFTREATGMKGKSRRDKFLERLQGIR
jgi:hypothetical protein